jgi:hypothetical protein
LDLNKQKEEQIKRIEKMKIELNKKRHQFLNEIYQNSQEDEGNILQIKKQRESIESAQIIEQT